MNNPWKESIDGGIFGAAGGMISVPFGLQLPFTDFAIVGLSAVVIVAGWLAVRFVCFD